eukprot:gene7039-7253_t
MDRQAASPTVLAPPRQSAPGIAGQRSDAVPEQQEEGEKPAAEAQAVPCVADRRQEQPQQQLLQSHVMELTGNQAALRNAIQRSPALLMAAQAKSRRLRAEQSNVHSVPRRPGPQLPLASTCQPGVTLDANRLTSLTCWNNCQTCGLTSMSNSIGAAQASSGGIVSVMDHMAEDAGQVQESQRISLPLRDLDVSFNLIPAEQLLGVSSPLADLPRLSELHAAGNSLLELPRLLGSFSSLTLLDLSCNKLHSAAVTPLGQLPALQLLMLHSNPIASLPSSLAEQMVCQSGAAQQAGAAEHRWFPNLTELDLSQTKVSAVQELLPVRQLRRLQLLRLVDTPLAKRSSVKEGAVQLPAVAEDPDGIVDQPSASTPPPADPGRDGQGVPAMQEHADHEVEHADQTFITGVGITGHLPEEVWEDEEECQSMWEDPTERVALALGLAVVQLAHYTHHQPVNPDAAVHRLSLMTQLWELDMLRAARYVTKLLL